MNSNFIRLTRLTVSGEYATQHYVCKGNDFDTETSCDLQHPLGCLGGLLPRSLLHAGRDGSPEPPDGLAGHGDDYWIIRVRLLVGRLRPDKALADCGCWVPR